MTDKPEVKYSPELLYAYILSCLIDDKGVPRFMETTPFHPLEDRTILVACRDWDDNDLLISIKVKDVPEELYNLIKQKGPHRPAEWKKVLAALLDKETLFKLDIPKVKSSEKSLMAFFSEKIKIEKVPKDEAIKIYKEIKGPKTFYDLF